MIDVSREIKFQTTRSGGKGGQNVNKVETAVIGAFSIGSSALLNAEQQALVRQKLSHRINSDDVLQVKSQTQRTQLGNKDEVTERINQLIHEALKKKKARIATRPNKHAREKRLESKKKTADIKSRRKKFNAGDF